MSVEIPTSSLTPGTSFEWADDADNKVIEAIHCWGGTFMVDHQLPPKLETTILLRTTGMGVRAVSAVMCKSQEMIKAYSAEACDALGVPGRYQNSRVLPAIGRLCLPGGILDCTEPVPSQLVDEGCIRILESLGIWGNWDKAARAAGYPSKHSARGYMKRYCDLEPMADEFKSSAALLLHSYGSGALNPTYIVSEQGGGPPVYPLKLPLPAPKAPLKTVEQQYRRPEFLNNAEGLDPQPLQPFADLDKLIWFTRPSGSNLCLSHIEACGASLEVLDKDTITNARGKEVELDSRDKFALVLIALGATLEEVDAYCMGPYPFNRLVQKLGIQNVSNKSKFTEMTILTCRELLSPITSPEWQGNPPDFSFLDGYIGKANEVMSTSEKRSRRASLAEQGHLYKLEDAPDWSTMNLMILLSYADDRLPETSPNQASRHVHA